MFLYIYIYIYTHNNLCTIRYVSTDTAARSTVMSY